MENTSVGNVPLARQKCSAAGETWGASPALLGPRGVPASSRSIRFWDLGAEKLFPQVSHLGPYAFSSTVLFPRLSYTHVIQIL